MQAARTELQVLIVSDSPEQLRAIEASLNAISAPYRTTTAGTAQLDESLRDRGWSAVICAPEPGVRVEELIERVRAGRPSLPLLWIVERESEESAAQAVLHGASDCIAKQHLDRLPHALEEALHAERTRQDERRRTEQEKIESIRELASGVAHEVKNPLTVILMGIDFLTRKTRSQDEEMLAVLKDMEDAVRRVNEVILGLRELAAPQAVELRSESIVEVLERALRQVRHEFEKAEIAVQRQFDMTIPAFPIDGTKMEQAFVNLLLSSSQAMPQGGTVKIRVARTEPDGTDPSRTADRADGLPSSIRIEIEDDGAGVPEQEIDRVFDPFHASKTAGRGTGVALTVVRRIVEMHGGAVLLQNRREGGVRMILSLSSPKEELPSSTFSGGPE